MVTIHFQCYTPSCAVTLEVTNFFVNNGRQSSAFLVALLTYTYTVLTETHFAGCALLIAYSAYSLLMLFQLPLQGRRSARSSGPVN